MNSIRIHQRRKKRKIKKDLVLDEPNDNDLDIQFPESIIDSSKDVIEKDEQVEMKKTNDCSTKKESKERTRKISLIRKEKER